MSEFLQIKKSLAAYTSVEGGTHFFRDLGYPVMDPLRHTLDRLPQTAQETIASLHQLAHVGDVSPFRIFHVELAHPTIRRTDIRRFLEAFYRHYPQGENLFVFAPRGSFEELAFVSPRRIHDPRDREKVRLWLRILQVRRDHPYRTDLEVLNRIRVDGVHDPNEIWRRHEEAFSVQRVTEQFFQDYREVFLKISHQLRETHKENGAEWARDYTHQLLNRIMFIYFIARKGWLLGPDGKPDRYFMRHFWEAYRDSDSQDTFHTEWLPVLFFEAFNNRWQNRHEYLKRFPQWLVQAFAQAPYLNGGLYTPRPGIDDRLETPLPDDFFALLFEQWTDGTFPGLFERYNFTVVETGRFDEEVAVDPEMLGTVYERLVNITFEAEGKEEDVRGAAGIFYTPRVEIDLMCRLALVDWLSNQLGDDKKELLYRWVFAFSEEEKEKANGEVTNEGLWETLSDLVRRVRVCDPACGSGSFLVGMMLVLDDLQARCNLELGIDETPYERRRRILQDQLYGVDVMDWAVRVAELRLWLQLVVETELQPAELHFRPLLPNLDLKLRPGDSLLQTVGDLNLSPFRRSELPLSRQLKGRLTQLKGKKRRFFQGEEPGLTVTLLKQEEVQLFRDILWEKTRELDNQIKTKRQEMQVRQVSLPGMEKHNGDDQEKRRQLEEEIRALEEAKDRYERAYKALRPDQPPFVWDLAFAEIFEDDNPGFDIVIGNPPYVRQEKIRDYLNRFDRKEYLERLNESLRAIYPSFMSRERKLAGRADYYVYFYLHSLSLLADRGTFCFVTSNSWLDVDFGKDLQEFFLRYGHLKMVIDNRARRSFAQADVNTVIVLAGAPERRRVLTEEQMKERKVRFVAFRVPFEEALSPVVFLEIEDEHLYKPLAGFQVLTRPEYRSVLHDQWRLYREGLEEAEEEQLMQTPKYAGNKWGGKYLRAPDIFFTILEKGRGKLVRLGDIAEVRFGIKTGANEFFYLEPVGLTVKEVAELAQRDPKAPVRVRNGAGWQGEIEAGYLKPMLFSLKECPGIRLDPCNFHHLVFLCRKTVSELKRLGHTHALGYIKWGNNQTTRGGKRLPNAPSLRSRPLWYALPDQKPMDFISNRFIGERFLFVQGSDVLVCDVFFVGYFDQNRVPDPNVGLALLNSTLTVLVADVLGRKTYGIGVIYLYGPEVNGLLLMEPTFLTTDHQKALQQAFIQMSHRPIRSIFEELGFVLCRQRGCQHPEHPYEFVRPEVLTLEQVRQASPDRFELDSVVFDVLGLTDEERLEVYRAVAQLVKDRLVKARSV